MNNNRSEMNYYENDSIQTIEKAILAEKLVFTGLAPVEAKFFIPSTTPSLETSGNAKVSTSGKYTQANYIELVIPTQILLMFTNPKLIEIEDIKHNPSKCGVDCSELKHTSTSCKYVLGFTSNKFTIPKGTEFLVEFLGGDMKIENMVIVGVYSLTATTTP